MTNNKMITREELKKYIFNPELAQKAILDKIDFNNPNIGITNATSPFNMLLEATATFTSNSVAESINVMRGKYPNLALTRKDLSHHMSDDEIAGIYSKPGEVNLQFRISITDLLSNGYRPVGAKYTEVTIPEKTVINVLKTDLTLLNDILVRYYDSGTSYVEMQPSDNPISTKDIGIIPSTIISTKDEHMFLYFEVKVKQITINSLNYSVIAGEGFHKEISFKNNDDKFYYISVAYENSSTNNKRVNLPIGYNDEYLDPYTPTAFVSIVDNTDTEKFNFESVYVNIPDVYFLNNDISGTIYVDLYETKGGIYLPLIEASPLEYSLTLGLTGKSKSTAVSPNIAIVVSSQNVITSGSDGMSFMELRDAIVFNTRGEQNLPITDYQLSFNNILDRFEVLKNHDILTERVYVAMRNLDKLYAKELRAQQDVYFNTISILLERFTKHRYVKVFEDNFIIHSGAVFKSYNSITEIVSEEQLEAMSKLTDIEKIDYYKEAKYFATPYYYIISRKDNISNSRVYELDRPKLESMKILGTNRDIEHRANTSGFVINKVPGGYEVITTIYKNNETAMLDPDTLHIVMTLPLISNNKLFIDGKYKEATDTWHFFIESNMYVDINNNLMITNGRATTVSNFVKLDTNIEFYIYTTDRTIKPDDAFMLDVIYKEPRPYIVINYETIDLKFGSLLTHIWNKLSLAYTERKYKTYKEDILSYYETDVLEPDPVTGLVIDINPNTNNVMARIVHKKGDPVMSNGEQVIAHKKGDTILDEYGNPIIDDLGGMIRNIDICMLDYEFYLATHPAYGKHNLMVQDQLKEYLLELIPDKNDVLLENTSLLYKSYKSSLPIRVKINEVIYALDSIISPAITIYYDQNSELKITSSELDNIKDRVGSIIDKYLENRYIKLSELRALIMKSLGDDVISVKITNIDINNSEYIIFEDRSARMSLNKVLVLNDYNQLEVKYDVKVNIQTL